MRIYAENRKFMKFVNMFQKVLVNKLCSLNRCENTKKNSKVNFKISQVLLFPMRKFTPVF